MPADGPRFHHSQGRDELPRELVAALASAPRAQELFAGLSPSHRREYVRWVREGRRDDTRERRAAQTVMRLLEKVVLPEADPARDAIAEAPPVEP